MPSDGSTPVLQRQFPSLPVPRTLAMQIRSFVSAVLASLALSVAAHAGVVVVNPTTSDALQLAIDSALEGDTVLVHPGAYGAVHIAGKGLTVVANAPGTVQVESLTISGLSASQTCAVTSVRVTGYALPEAAAVRVLQCAGPVRLVDVNATMPTMTTVTTIVPSGMHVSASDDVVLARCIAQGGVPFFGQLQPPPSGVGLRLIDSRVAVWDSTVNGGNGRDAIWIQPPAVAYPSSAGAVGILGSGTTTLYASGSTIRGGRGGNGVVGLCSGGSPTAGSNGANAIVTVLPANLRECTITAGIGGSGGSCAWCPPAPQPPPGCGAASGITATPTSGPIVQVPGDGAALATSGLVREGNALSLSIGGTAGDFATLVISPRTRHELFLPLGGTLHYGTGTRRLALGQIPGTGVLDATLPVGSLAAGVDALQRHLQVLTRPAGGASSVGSPAVLTILDQQF